MFPDVVLVSGLNKNIDGSTVFGGKRHGLADLHTPIQYVYIASIATMPTVENFAKSLPSFKSVSHSLTLLSNSRVNIACCPESALSHKKHFSFECLGVQDDLDRRQAFIGLSGSETSACFLFFARSSFVLLNKSLQDLCHARRFAF